MLQINPTFKNLIRQLTDQEYSHLEVSILAEGCRDPLVVWGDVLVDGHNRHAICTEHGLKYQITSKEFADEDEAVAWIIDNQLARRNLTPDELAYYIGKKYGLTKKRWGGTGANQHKEQRGKSFPSAKTAQIVGDQFGVSDRTVKNNYDYSQAVDTLAQTLGDDMRTTITGGALRATREQVQTLAKMAEDEPAKAQAIIDRVASDPDVTMPQAFKDLKRAEQKEAYQQAKAESYKPLASLVEVLHGDMLAIVPTLPHKYQLIVADPPYNVTNQEWDKFGTPQAFLDQTALWLDTLKGVMADEYNLFWFCFPTYAADIEMILRPRFTIQSRLVWHRRNMATGSDAKYKFIDSWEMCFHCGNRPLNYPEKWDDSRFDVQTFASPQQNFTLDTGYHPTQKPLELIKRLVSYGSYAGDHILDPFGGSGTTGEAALLAGDRHCTLIEREAKYIDVINERLGL